MVKIMRVLVVVGLLFAFSKVTAEDVAPVEIEQEKLVDLAQVAPQEDVVKVAQVEPKEELDETVVQVAQTEVKAPVEDSVQVASIDEEVLDAAEKVLTEDPATQVATADQEFDLNFDDFEFSEEEEV